MDRIGKPHRFHHFVASGRKYLEVGFRAGENHNIAAVIAAEAFAEGRVSDSVAGAIMYYIMLALARGGAGIADEICASVALYLAEVEVPRRRMTKDGFAYGIAQKEYELLPITINGRAYALPVYGVPGRKARRRRKEG
jgi:hypothetical protein